MKTGDFIIAKNNSNFLNQLLGSNHPDFMASGLSLPDHSWLWMVQLGKFETPFGWVNFLETPDRLIEAHENSVDNINFDNVNDGYSLSTIDIKNLNLLYELCPDFQEYHFIKHDLYKGSLLGGTNVYFKKGQNNTVGMVSTERNIKRYNLERYTYNFQTEGVKKGDVEHGWTGEVLFSMLSDLLKYKKFDFERPITYQVSLQRDIYVPSFENRVVFDICETNGTTKYIFRGVFGLNTEECTLTKNVWDKLSDEYDF